MTLRFITRITRPPASTRRTLKQWADLPDYNEGGIDQFAYLRAYQLDKNGVFIGDMSANNVGPTLSHFDMLHIAELQVPDEFTTDQKMEYLTCGGATGGSGSVTNGCIMDIPGGGNWSTASAVNMVGAVWAGNQVEVLERRTFPNVRYGGVVADIPMSRIQTFDRKTDWGKTYFTHPHIVHSVMAVGRDDIPHKPKGSVYLPIIFPFDSVWVFDSLLV